MIATARCRSGWLVVVALSCVLAMEVASAQTRTAADGPWAGWVRCEITAQGAGYTDHQTHTWVMTGGAPRIEGVFRVYPATWSVVGGGSVGRTQGTNVTAEWATNGQASNAPIAVWTRGDGHLVFTLRHDQLRAPNGFTGYRFYTTDGKDQPRQAIAAETYEYRFPPIDDAPANSISGSSTLPIPSSNAFAPTPQPGSTGSASCTWQFVRGATTAVLPPSPSATSAAAATATAAPQVTLSAAGSGGTIQTASTGTSSGTTTKDTTLREQAQSSGALSGVTAVLMATASTEGMTATISGPKNLTAGMKGTFNLTLTPNPSDTVLSSAGFTFDSSEGETADVSLPTASRVLSATFTFQTAGTYAVSARGTAARTRAVSTTTPVYTTQYVHDPSCNCDKPSSVVTRYETETRYLTDVYSLSVQQQVVVSTP